MRTKKFIILCAVVLVFLFTGSVQAQGTFDPSRSNFFPNTNPPRFSPWLELERRSTTGLDSYNQFVRPEIEIRRTIQTQQREIMRQQEKQSLLKNEVRELTTLQEPGTTTQTGKGATFRNFSHFFPIKQRR